MTVKRTENGAGWNFRLLGFFSLDFNEKGVYLMLRTEFMVLCQLEREFRDKAGIWEKNGCMDKDILIKRWPMKLDEKMILKSRQRSFALILCAVCTLLMCGCAKKTPKVYRVGIISGAEYFTSIADGFKAKMTELGYTEGKNIVYNLQKLNADPEGEKRAAKKFVEDNVDLIFAFPTDPAVAAKTAARGTNIPVVFAMAGIEESNLVENVRQPGGNITGVRFPSPENTALRFEILHELAPQAKRIYILYDPLYPNAPFALNSVRSTASSLGIALVEEPVKDRAELQTALERRSRLADIGIDAVYLMPDIINNSGFGLIIQFANEHKLPVGGGMHNTADLGAMFSCVPDNPDQGRLAAVLVDKIFDGIPAGTLPVVTPESYLRLNYKVIQKHGLKASDGLLSRANEIIR
ncbi:MAG: ABC transporter substrate-binding protein [Fibrobacterota bacterium]